MTSSSRITENGHLGPFSVMEKTEKTAKPDTPRYVHLLLDALLNGTALDFHGEEVPDDVMTRLIAASNQGQLKVTTLRNGGVGSIGDMGPVAEWTPSTAKPVQPAQPAQPAQPYNPDDAEKLLVQALDAHGTPHPPKYKMRNMLAIMLNEMMSDEAKYAMLLDAARTLTFEEADYFCTVLNRLCNVLVARQATETMLQIPMVREMMRKLYPDAFDEDGRFDLAKIPSLVAPPEMPEMPDE